MPCVAVRSFRLWKLKGSPRSAHTGTFSLVAVRSFRLWKLKDNLRAVCRIRHQEVAVRSFRLWKLKATKRAHQGLSVPLLQFVRSDCGN